MNLTLCRDDQNEKRTHGILFSEDGDRICETLELPWKENQHDISCIPEGSYECKLLYSPIHRRKLYWLQSVPNRIAIEIHIGNTVDDTKGCILLGTVRLKDSIGASRVAFDKFMELMDGKDFTLTIEKNI